LNLPQRAAPRFEDASLSRNLIARRIRMADAAVK